MLPLGDIISQYLNISQVNYIRHIYSNNSIPLIYFFNSKYKQFPIILLTENVTIK